MQIQLVFYLSFLSYGIRIHNTCPKYLKTLTDVQKLMQSTDLVYRVK